MALPEDPEDLSPGTAAERTRLAWERTAIAFGAVGLAMLRREPVAGVLVLAATPVIVRTRIRGSTDCGIGSLRRSAAWFRRHSR